MVTLSLQQLTAHAIDWSGVPHQYRYKRGANGHFYEQPSVSAVVRSLTEAEDLVHFFRNPQFAPDLPVLVMVPGQVPISIIGNGVTPAAELRDLAVTVFERTIERVARNGGRIFDFDELREKAGLLPHDQFDPAFREALRERRRRHMANPRTDPPRKQWWPAGSAAVRFDMGAARRGGNDDD